MGQLKVMLLLAWVYPCAQPNAPYMVASCLSWVPPYTPLNFAVPMLLVRVPETGPLVYLPTPCRAPLDTPVLTDCPVVRENSARRMLIVPASQICLTRHCNLKKVVINPDLRG
ncbi:hypothetical protein FKM82_003647 [Ascaphus truei]